jgi:recombination protein RecA
MAKSNTNEVMSIISDLRKSFGGSLPNVSEAGKVCRLILSSPKLNYAFGGGYPIGRITEMFGPESGGKSVLSEYIGGQFQRREDSDQRVVVYIDIEHTFDEHYANVAGLDTSEDVFILVRPLNGEEGFKIAEELIKTGKIAFIVWDSTTATPTASAMEDEYGKRSFGGSALLFSDGLKKLNPYISRFKTSLNLLTQMRAKIGNVRPGMPADAPSGGGYAPRFYASWRGRVSKGEDIMDGLEPIGNQIRLKNVKSKIGFPKRSAELDLYYSTGFNSDAEYVDFASKLGIVEKKGSWFSKPEWDFKGQGSNSLLTFLKDHKDIFEEVKAQINSTFSSFSVLDEQESIDTGTLPEDEIIEDGQ